MRVILVDNDSKNARSFKLSAIAKFFLSACLLGIPTLVGFIGFQSLSHDQLINKDVTQDFITAIIQNDGDLRSIKQALLSQEADFKLHDILTNSKQDYYPKNIPLSTVLEDIRVNQFLSSDKTILERLDKIIKEYEETNPFDGLQNSQRDLFVNIRIKSGNEYLKISNDINNIADELRTKNQLVDEYLSDSKTSYWISIAGLLLSLIIGCIQIYWQLSSKRIEVKLNEDEKQQEQFRPAP